MPPEFAAFMIAFQPLFSKSVFQHASVLVTGAILTPGRRTVASTLRTMGLGQITTFQNYHRVLSRAKWSPRQAAQILLSMLVRTFADERRIVKIRSSSASTTRSNAAVGPRSRPKASTAIR